ncbi:MAG: hypothetical protein V2I66_11205 [Halieaceae bacterium]|nr:hypothetical protein [Halieaceae bacterium]
MEYAIPANNARGIHDSILGDIADQVSGHLVESVAQRLVGGRISDIRCVAEGRFRYRGG